MPNVEFLTVYESCVQHSFQKGCQQWPALFPQPGMNTKARLSQGEGGDLLFYLQEETEHHPLRILNLFFPF